MRSFVVLENWGLTPADLGMSWDEVDPLWLDAMLVLKAGVSDGQRKPKGR